MARIKTMKLHGLARAYLAGKLPDWKWISRDPKLMQQIKEMAEKIKTRASKRGKQSWKRTFPNSDYHLKQDGKGCHFCFPDSKSYGYKEHGRIDHSDLRNAVKADGIELASLMGETPDEDCSCEQMEHDDHCSCRP